MKSKIAIFSGAGISRESGILTFRDSADGLWNNHKIDDVATPSGWRKDRKLVLDFYNERRRQLPEVFPNEAHKALVLLEKDYDVTIVTQNVDDLHERAGSTDIIHLHGELTKARGCMYDNKTSPIDQVLDIGYNDINIGDKCSVTQSQLRPHIVWFNEYPLEVKRAGEIISNADIVLIIGTSLQITYTIDMLNNVRHIGDEFYGGKEACKVIYIDPHPSRELDPFGLDIEYVKKSAVEGVVEIVERLLKKF